MTTNDHEVKIRNAIQLICEVLQINKITPEVGINACIEIILDRCVNSSMPSERFYKILDDLREGFDIRRKNVNEENDDEYFEHLNKIFEDHSEALHEAISQLEPQPDGMLFSKELRDAMAPFGKMDVRDALKSGDFFKALAKHAGMSDEEFDAITKKSENK
jgi:hypothetical protein